MPLQLLGDCRHLAVRGALCLLYGVRFEGDPEVHAKYCLLLESYLDGKRDIVGAFGTSNLAYHFVFSSFVIPGRALNGEPPEDTLVQLDNYAFLSRQRLFERRTFYVGQLTPDLVRALDDALTHLHVEPALMIRMMG